MKPPVRRRRSPEADPRRSPADDARAARPTGAVLRISFETAPAYWNPKRCTRREPNLLKFPGRAPDGSHRERILTPPRRPPRRREPTATSPSIPNRYPCPVPRHRAVHRPRGSLRPDAGAATRRAPTGPRSDRRRGCPAEEPPKLRKGGFTAAHRRRPRGVRIPAQEMARNTPRGRNRAGPSHDGSRKSLQSVRPRAGSQVPFARTRRRSENRRSRNSTW